MQVIPNGIVSDKDTSTLLIQKSRMTVYWERMRRTTAFVTVISALLLCAGCDGYTRLEGTVCDSSGARISGATVVFDTGRSERPLQLITAADGRYRIGSTHAPFADVPLTLKVSKAGFKTFEHRFTSGREHTKVIDIVLEPEAATSRVPKGVPTPAETR